MTQASNAYRAALKMLREDFPALDEWAIVRDCATYLREEGFPITQIGLYEYCYEKARSEHFSACSFGPWAFMAQFAGHDDGEEDCAGYDGGEL